MTQYGTFVKKKKKKKKAGKILVTSSAESVSLSSAVVSRPRVLPSLEELVSLLSSMLISLSSSATEVGCFLFRDVETIKSK